MEKKMSTTSKVRANRMTRSNSNHNYNHNNNKGENARSKSQNNGDVKSSKKKNNVN